MGELSCSKITIATSHLSGKKIIMFNSNNRTLSYRTGACAWTRVVSGIPFDKESKAQTTILQGGSVCLDPSGQRRAL